MFRVRMLLKGAVTLSLPVSHKLIYSNRSVTYSVNYNSFVSYVVLNLKLFAIDNVVAGSFQNFVCLIQTQLYLSNFR